MKHSCPTPNFVGLENDDAEQKVKVYEHGLQMVHVQTKKSDMRPTFIGGLHLSYSATFKTAHGGPFLRNTYCTSAPFRHLQRPKHLIMNTSPAPPLSRTRRDELVRPSHT